MLGIRRSHTVAVGVHSLDIFFYLVVIVILVSILICRLLNSRIDGGRQTSIKRYVVAHGDGLTSRCGHTLDKDI